MPIIKCKMCGGDLNLVEGSTVCECEYCGTKQTVPSADNEKKLTLFNRAGRLLRACEFDKAAGVFETIVADFHQEAEAYWGLVLCKYGIEYVDDPATGKKIPTCHRSSFDSVLDDANFEQACENTDAVARRVYRDEARQIEALRQAILQVSGKEEPYDVFISYKETDANGERTLDSVIAQDIYKELTNEGYRVFFSRISLEDKLGAEYEPYIFAALNSAKVMLVVGTDYENFDAVWVKNEWSRFLKLIAKGEKKTLIPVFKNMDAYDMPKEFAKLAAQDMGKVGAMQDLVRGVEKLVGKKKAEPAQQVVQQTVVQGGGPNVAALLKRGQQALEDSEWDKAKDFYEQVLSMDAENADAFLGLALSAKKCRNVKAYFGTLNSLTGKQPSPDTATVKREQDHIRNQIASLRVPGYLEKTELSRLYDFDKQYSIVASRQKALTAAVSSEFNADRNLARAIQYASGERKQTLETMKREFINKLAKLNKAAEQTDQEAKQKACAAYKEALQSADHEAAEKNRAALKKREEDYQAACELLSKAQSKEDYRKARGGFAQVGDYKDAKQRLEECDHKIKEFLAAERAAKEKAAAKSKRIKTVIAVSLVAALAVFLIIVTVILPSNRYSQAMSLFDAGDYSAAKTAFDDLNGYKDSDDYAQESYYQIGLAMLREKEYDNAIEIFTSLGSYKDSAEQMMASQYEKAVFLRESAEFEQARTIFEELGDYSDSKTQIIETSYCEAIYALENGNYMTAVSLFSSLDTYKDSKEMIRKTWVEATGDLKVGDRIQFGKYQVVANADEDGTQQLKEQTLNWVVLEIDEETLSARLLCGDLLQKRPYADMCYSYRESSLASWLNGEFLENAFSEREQNCLIDMKTDESKYARNLPVQLLSYDELNKHERIIKTSGCGGMWWLGDVYLFGMGVYVYRDNDSIAYVEPSAEINVRPLICVDFSDYKNW